MKQTWLTSLRRELHREWTTWRKVLFLIAINSASYENSIWVGHLHPFCLEHQIIFLNPILCAPASRCKVSGTQRKDFYSGGDSPSECPLSWGSSTFKQQVKTFLRLLNRGPSFKLFFFNCFRPEDCLIYIILGCYL